MFTWHPISELPKFSGNYLVGHRGYQRVIAFIADELPASHPANRKSGWQDSLDFKPTHWMRYPSPE